MSFVVRYPAMYQYITPATGITQKSTLNRRDSPHVNLCQNIAHLYNKMYVICLLFSNLVVLNSILIWQEQQTTDADVWGDAPKEQETSP